MGNEVFLSSVKTLTEGNMTVGEVIGAAATLQTAGEADQSAQIYSLWVRLNKEDPLLYVVLFNLSVTLSNLGDLKGAREALERCIVLNPNFYPAYINLGGVLEKMGVVGDAITQWFTLVDKLAVITGADFNYKITALKQIGRVLESNLHFAQAEAILRQSLEINPDQPDVTQHFIAHRLAQCEWPVVSPWEGMARKTLMKGIGPLSMAVYTDDPMLQLASAWNYSKSFIGYPTSGDLQEHHQAVAVGTRPGRRRIGYVSSDLRNHAVGFIMAELFGLHDRSEFEVFVYYCGIQYRDDLKDRIRDSVEHWTDINGMDDDAAARQILADGIDILIDVNGFTKDARTKMFSLRPAPIIVNWLGYPGSMGSPYHHYIIADDYIIPKGHEIYYSEKVVRLPCYQPNDRKRAPSPNMPSRRDVGLPEDAVVFCCFNGVQKITRFTFERWMAILARVEGSVLWLLQGAEGTKERLLGYAAQYGIPPERIIFAGKIANTDHIARYPLADLFLDTSPYGAHVTASDALWMGVPILTFSGRSFASRVCGSLVTAAGMEELICSGPEEYIEKAVALGKDRARITELKKRLAANRDSCVLFDTESTVHHLEKLYKQMWKDFLQGHLPRPDLSNLDVYLEVGGELDHEAAEMLTVKDYQGLYKAKLEQRHKYCSVHADQRLWTKADIAEADGTADHARLPAKKNLSEAGSRKPIKANKELCDV